MAAEPRKAGGAGCPEGRRGEPRRRLIQSSSPTQGKAAYAAELHYLAVQAFGRSESVVGKSKPSRRRHDSPGGQ